MDVFSGRKSEDVLDFLMRRRSALVQDLKEPGPSADELEKILTAGARVPDHGKMVPWYFIVFEGQGSRDAGKVARNIFARENPDSSDERLQIEEERFSRSPLVIAVVSRIRKGKKPMWEQVLSSGAACMNMSLAAHACGYGVQWLTEWYAFDPAFRAYLGLDDCDQIAGFLHIGSYDDKELEDRDRPALEHIVTRWADDAELNKGDGIYGQDKYGYPETGLSNSHVLFNRED